MVKKISKADFIEKELKKYDIDIESLNVDLLLKFKTHIKKNIKDPRQQWKIEYKIWDIVITTIIAVLCNNDEATSIHDFVVAKREFFKKFLKLTGGIASQDTYERVISLIDSNTLQDCLNYFVLNVLTIYSNEKDILNFDGKTDKGSKRDESMTIEEKVKPLNVLNVYSNQQKLCIYSEMINDKTNEIPAVYDVLDKLNISNTVITWDALNTQIKNIEKVIDKEGDYVVPIKGNQGTFFDDLKLYFNEEILDEIRAGKLKSVYKKEKEKSHGQIYTYEYFQTEEIKWYCRYREWKGLKSFGLVVKTIETKTEIKQEIRYYISSLYNDIELFSKSIREHWSVENKLHWHLDFTFKQDNNTTMNKKLLFNLQIIKKFCLGLLERVKDLYGISLQRIRHKLELNVETEIPRFFNILNIRRNRKSNEK